jgi:hypothetical protein
VKLGASSQLADFAQRCTPGAAATRLGDPGSAVAEMYAVKRIDDGGRMKTVRQVKLGKHLKEDDLANGTLLLEYGLHPPCLFAHD